MDEKITPQELRKFAVENEPGFLEQGCSPSPQYRMMFAAAAEIARLSAVEDALQAKTSELYPDLRAEIDRLRATLLDARKFIEGLVKPAAPGVHRISSYHPCHALIDKINAALATKP